MKSQEALSFGGECPKTQLRHASIGLKKHFIELGGMNVLINKNTDAFIGQCGLLVQIVDGIQELEVGYSMLPKYWKQGYATEAAQKCKAFAKENAFAKSIISIIHVDNIPSQKVAINNGMHLDKTTEYDENPVHIFRVKL